MDDIVQKFEISPEAEDTLSSIAMNNGYRVYGEVGLLYLRLKRWYEKYGNIPSAKYLNKIIRFINADVAREETKIRTKDGKLSGSGLGVSFTSLDKTISNNNESAVGELIEFISDNNSPLPNEIERFNLEKFFEHHGSLKVREVMFLRYYVREGKSVSEISELFGVSISRVVQLKEDLFGRLRKSYLEYSSPTNSKPHSNVDNIEDNKYVDYLIKKKEKIDAYRDKLIRKKRPKKRKYTLTKEYKYELENQATPEFTLKLYKEFKTSLLTLRQICEKYRVSYDSFRQQAYKLGLPYAELNREKENAQKLAVCAEWEAYKGPMKLRAFCKERGYNYPNVINWLKKKKELQSKWYCLKTKVKREHIVAAGISKLEGVDTFAPQITINRQTINGKKKFTEPMFPGYFFVKFSLEDFGKISHFPGVTGAVKLYEKYPEIPDFVIDNLRKEVQAKGIETKETLEEGDLVEILEGSFKGLCTKVYRPDIGENRVALLIEILGKSVQINVKANQIEKIA